VAAYWQFVESYYVKDGRPTYLGSIKIPLRLLRQHYGDTPASQFGPLALKALQMRMIEAGHSRRYQKDSGPDAFDGGNIIPLAEQFPESQFLGIDFSQVQVSQGQQVIDSLQLKNIELKHLNILDVDAELGEFNYIIAHGVFSWVSDEVQEHMLEICRQNLSPRGVAYVSYNTYPG
jgi:hypothetical protein